MIKKLEARTDSMSGKSGSVEEIGFGLVRWDKRNGGSMGAGGRESGKAERLEWKEEAWVGGREWTKEMEEWEGGKRREKNGVRHLQVEICNRKDESVSRGSFIREGDIK